MKPINIGNKVTVKFTFEVDGIRKNSLQDGVLTLTGWITLNNKRVEYVAIPDICLVENGS